MKWVSYSSDSSCIIGYFDGMSVRDFCALFKYTTKTVKRAVEKGVCQYFVNCRLNAGRIWASTPRINGLSRISRIRVLTANSRIYATDSGYLPQETNGLCYRGYLPQTNSLCYKGSVSASTSLSCIISCKPVAMRKPAIEMPIEIANNHR